MTEITDYLNNDIKAIDINESIEIEDNQALSHVTINIEYTSH